MGLQTRIVESSSGTKFPALGLGTFDFAPDGKVANAVKEGLLAGYRHIDTAAAYKCEGEVGEGIRASGVPREDIFLVTKFWNTHHQPEDVVKSLDDSLKRLKLDYVDLFLMHWPLAFKRTEDYETARNHEGKPIIDYDLTENHEPTWRAMESLVRAGKTRAIGVSNFTIPQLEKLLSYADIKPACNQVEAHPYLPQNELLEFGKKHGIPLVAYSPFGSQFEGVVRPIVDEDVVEVAKKNGIEPAQVLISWAIQRGTVPIPKSATPSRVRTNFNVPELSPEDFKKIDEITIRDPSKKNRIIALDRTEWNYPYLDGSK